MFGSDQDPAKSDQYATPDARGEAVQEHVDEPPRRSACVGSSCDSNKLVKHRISYSNQEDCIGGHQRHRALYLYIYMYIYFARIPNLLLASILSL